MNYLLALGGIVLVIVIPLSAVITIFAFWRNPYRGSMLAALHMIVATAVSVLSGSYDVSFEIGTDLGLIKNIHVALKSGSSEWSGLIVLVLAIILYVIATWFYTTDRRKQPHNRRKQPKKDDVNKATSSPFSRWG